MQTLSVNNLKTAGTEQKEEEEVVVVVVGGGGMEGGSFVNSVCEQFQD